MGVLEDDGATRDDSLGLVPANQRFEFLWGHGGAETALLALAEEQPNVMLADINLPGMNGIEFVRQAKLGRPATQFLMVTVYEDVDHIFAALAAGATGVSFESHAPQGVADGGAGSPCRRLADEWAYRPQGGRSFSRVRGPRIRSSLSPRENEILGLLAKGYFYKEIGVQLGISVFTVNNSSAGSMKSCT